MIRFSLFPGFQTSRETEIFLQTSQDPEIFRFPWIRIFFLNFWEVSLGKSLFDKIFVFYLQILSKKGVPYEQIITIFEIENCFVNLAPCLVESLFPPFGSLSRMQEGQW